MSVLLLLSFYFMFIFVSKNIYPLHRTDCFQERLLVKFKSIITPISDLNKKDINFV